MEGFDSFVNRISSDISNKCNCKVTQKKISDGYHLKGNRVFAWVRRVEHGRVVPNNCFPIQVKEQHAIVAKLSDFGDRRDENGFYNEPALYFNVLDGDKRSYDRALNALTQICKILH